MAFPGNVNKYVISGTLAGGETWSTAFYGEVTLPGTAQSLADDFDAASSFGAAWLTAVQRLMAPNGSAINRIQVYIYGVGRTIVDQGEAPLTLVATKGTAQASNTQALVMTLRTATNSRRGRGRMFLPANGLAMDSDGMTAAANVTPVVAATANLMGFYNGQVVSEAAGAAYAVTRVDSDRRTDTMRSRSDKLRSSRITADVTP